MLYTAPTAEVRETFHQGTNHRAYEMLGAHPCFQGDAKKWHFAVWAPNAMHVSLVGEFNLRDKSRHPMIRQTDGIWEAWLPEEELLKNLKEEGFPTYQYAILGADDLWRFKADPFAFSADPAQHSASLIYDMDRYEWADTEWMQKRRRFHAHTSPVNIYEVHAGSWKRHEDGSFLTCLELADELIPYVQMMGYTHIEFLSFTEPPKDTSSVDHTAGLFSCADCFGTPDEFRQLIDRCHRAEIGVILDWTAELLPCDEVGLYKFDGTDLFNRSDIGRSGFTQKSPLFFDLKRGEVCSYLLSSICFWIDQFHVDGIRMEAVNRMICCHWDKAADSNPANKYGGHEHLEGISFLRSMNEMIHRTAPDVMLIAGENNLFSLFTAPVYTGGLGFSFEWNTEWTNDMLSYIQLDPIYRKYHHDKLTFSLRCAFKGNYILPFSHKEVTQDKRSMLDKNPGDLWRKFAGLRALYGYTMAHPGKKLLFMGGEFGHFIEWQSHAQLDWFLLSYERHAMLQECVKKLNHLYKELPAFYEADNTCDSFQWITPNDTDNSIIAFLRTDKADRSILCVTNFTPVFHPVYRVPLPCGGRLNELFNTDRAEYGGSNQYNAYEIHVHAGDYNGFPFWADICVPPLSTIYLTYDKILP